MHTLLFLLLALSIGSSQIEAVYQSPLGYSARVPSGWLVITQELLKREPDLFDRVLQNLVHSDPGLANSLREEVRAGELDVLLRAEPGSPRFVDNINIRGQKAKLAFSKDLVSAVCAQLLNPPAGSSPQVDGLRECVFKEAAGHPAMFMRKLGNGTTTLQFQILVSPTRVLAVTAVAKSETVDAVEEVLNDLVQSLEFRRE